MAKYFKPPGANFRFAPGGSFYIINRLIRGFLHGNVKKTQNKTCSSNPDSVTKINISETSIKNKQSVENNIGFPEYYI